MHVIKRMLWREDAFRQDDADRDERSKDADRRLGEQADRLNVLEWEAYGKNHYRNRKD